MIKKAIQAVAFALLIPGLLIFDALDWWEQQFEEPPNYELLDGDLGIWAQAVQARAQRDETKALIRNGYSHIAFYGRL